MRDARVGTSGTTFSQLYTEIKGARGVERLKGSKVLYLKDGNAESAFFSATKFWAGQAGRKASGFMYDTIQTEYGAKVAKRVFRQVMGQAPPGYRDEFRKISLDKLRALKNALSYERKLPQYRDKGIKPATFTKMRKDVGSLKTKREQQGKGDFEPGKHLRFTAEKKLYVHTKWSTGFKNWFGFQTSRRDKRAAAGSAIWKAIAEEHSEGAAERVFCKVFGANAFRASGVDHKIAVTMQQFKDIENEIDNLDQQKTLLNDIKIPQDTTSPLDAIDNNPDKIHNKNNNNINKPGKNVPPIQNLEVVKIAKDLDKYDWLNLRLLEKEHEGKNLASVSDKDWQKLLAPPEDMPEAFTKSEERESINLKMRQAAVVIVAMYGLQAARCARQEIIDRIKDDVNLDIKLYKTGSFIERKYVFIQKEYESRDAKIQYHPFPLSREELENDFATYNGNKYIERKPHYFHLFTNPESKLSFPDSEFKKPLSALDRESVLKITGHGSSRHKDIMFQTRNSDEVDKQRKNGSCLTAADLAKQLKEDGLPLDHKLIRLNTCLAGGDFQQRWEFPPSDDKLNESKSNENQTRPSRDRQSDKIFGQELAMELKKLGYENIVVGAYPGAVGEPSEDDIREDRFTSKFTIVANADGQRKIGPTRGLCRYYDGDGNRVANPRNPDKHFNYVDELEIVNQFQEYVGDSKIDDLKD